MTTIGDRDGLLALQRTLRWLAPPRDGGPYEFRLPGYTEAQNSWLGSEMTRYGNACGCDSGGFLMSMGFVGMVLSYFLTGGAWSAIGGRHLLVLAAGTAAFALAGKIAGVLWARWRMFRLATGALASLRTE